jgi:hypothetical protein
MDLFKKKFNVIKSKFVEFGMLKNSVDPSKTGNDIKSIRSDTQLIIKKISLCIV